MQSLNGMLSLIKDVERGICSIIEREVRLALHIVIVQASALLIEARPPHLERLLS